MDDRCRIHHRRRLLSALTSGRSSAMRRGDKSPSAGSTPTVPPSSRNRFARVRGCGGGAGGGSRTHTGHSDPADFKSAASTVPPLRHAEVTGGIDVARAFDERAGRRRRSAPGAPARSIRPRYRCSPPGRPLCVYGGSQTSRVPLCGTTDRTSAGRLVVSSARGRPAKGAEIEVGTGGGAAKAAKSGTKKMVRAATSRRRSPPAPDKRRRDRLSTRSTSAARRVRSYRRPSRPHHRCVPHLQ